MTAYEPHPGTYAMLRRNVAAYPNIVPVNAAVYPTNQKAIPFSARHAGDGEAGVLSCSEETFGAVARNRQMEVAALHPGELPGFDVVKIDAEGAEAEIVRHLDLSATSLVLLEFQNDRNRALIKQQLAADFQLLLEEEFAWAALLNKEYNPGLADDHYGHLFFAARAGCKLRRPGPEARPRPSWRSIASEIVQKLRSR